MAISIAAALDQALRTAGIPIVGVSIGATADRTTWRVQFAPEATALHQTQAATLVTAFDPNDAAYADAELAQRFDGDKLFKAKALSDLAFRLGKAPGTLTANEITAERTRILTIYKAL